MDKNRILMGLGAIALLILIVVVPAVLVPMVMTDVPGRSMTRVIVLHDQAIQTVRRRFAAHRNEDRPGRVAPLPVDTRQWIEVVNPMGRKAPGGGLAILPQADERTGAIGLTGDDKRVSITMPAYGELERRVTVIDADAP